MLNPDRVPVNDTASLEGRNPFFVGEFEGQRLREIRAQRASIILIGSLVAALVIVSTMAAQAWWTVMHAPVCTVSAVDWTGDEYVVGQGDTFSDAMTGAVVPPNPREVIVVEGCNQ
ncbi:MULTISPECIES: hypothetical protein [Phyllobacteriaceae]|jgi:hypothetical protein|uniref:Uncharacterized protein n=1 Tax=Mesorhizobium hungaricum TaxID=1566387 RepID=A0A1C2DDH6_9HYPH|nr:MULTISPECIES: hypothetical protein [Mesorhizobium]MBN9235114.1 hypothetical protein [Mesorhizobium sp.]OCX12686.1 hypothetical protein QV13_24115 [Mesorhizobium hungaricum]